jgi:hypothetical protein
VACIPNDPANDCTVYQGAMNVYLDDTTNKDKEIDQARAQIQETIEDPSFGEDIWGFVSADYMADGSDPVPPIVDPDERSTNNAKDEKIGTGPLTVVLVGSASFVVFVATVYVWRRKSKKDSSEGGSVTEGGGAATQAAGSTLFILQDDSPREEGPGSPFSEMLPSAYRFNENMSILSGSHNELDVVFERSDESSVGDRSDMMVSDCGYTTEGDDSVSLGVTRSLYKKDGYVSDSSQSPLVLGARRRPISPGGTLLGKNAGLDDSDAVDDDLLPNMV